ncbi:MAG: hypothetical protein VX899_06100 [Myxococcota bacterium]|nr:hypothetical protein [Myxococcota bacterium]
MAAARITKPDINPLTPTIVNVVTLGGGGYLLMGQNKKAALAWAVTWIGGIMTCGLGFAFAFIAAYDAFKLCQRLEAGESIGAEENHFGWLDEVYRW